MEKIINRLFQKHAQIKQERFSSLPEKHMLIEIKHKERKKSLRLKCVETKEWQIRCEKRKAYTYPGSTEPAL